jgi:FMN phosphatase YigB (HAD superfamily)
MSAAFTSVNAALVAPVPSPSATTAGKREPWVLPKSANGDAKTVHGSLRPQIVAYPTVVTASAAETVFLLDVDNTLLDNDTLTEDLRRHLIDVFGVDCQRRYWDIFEARRRELGYADYLGALQRYREEHARDPQVLGVSLFLLQYPFRDRVYARAFDAIAALRQRGPVVILSDGDVVFQPYKIDRAGLWAAVESHVLIYVHKEQMLDDVEQRYPARHYVMVDDKLWILEAMKRIWGHRLTTIFIRQGHYARESRVNASQPADLAIDSIGELVDLARTL